MSNEINNIEPLKEYYVGKFWNTTNDLLIKLPKELVEHPGFPLRKELLLIVKPGIDPKDKKPCLVIKNVNI